MNRDLEAEAQILSEVFSFGVPSVPSLSLLDQLDSVIQYEIPLWLALAA